MALGKIAVDVLKTAMEVGIKENKTNVAKELQTAAMKASGNLQGQVSTLASDLTSTIRSPVNAAATSADIIKTIKKMNQVGMNAQEQEDYIFTTAAGYSKVFNSNLADTLSEFSDVANFHSAGTHNPILNLLSKDQAEYDSMFKRLEPYINEVALAKQTDIDMQQIKTLQKSDISKLDFFLKNIDTLSGDDAIAQSRVLNIMANNNAVQRTKKRAQKFLQKQEKQQDILDFDTDALYRKIQDTTISEKDIMTGFLKYRSLQGLSRRELQSLDNEIDFMLKNRADIAKHKNFSSEQFEQLRAMKKDIKEYFKNPTNNLARPLSKNAELANEIKMSDKSFIKHATGQNTSQLNYSADFKINGMLDPKEFKYGALQIKSNEIGSFIESGLSDLPAQRKALYNLFKEKHLPIQLREAFLPNAFKSRQPEMNANFATDEIAETLDMVPTSSMISKGDEALLFNDKLTKLKLLQAYGELDTTTIAKDMLNPNLAQQPFMKVNSAIELFKNIPGFDKRDLDFINYSLNLVNGINGEFKIALNKILTANPNAFDNIVSKNINLQTGFLKLKSLAKTYAPNTTDFRSLGDEILHSKTIPGPQKAILQRQYIDAVNDINSFIATLNGKVKTLQALDLPENWFVKSMDSENITSESAKTFNRVSPSSAKERELASSQMERDEIKEAALKARNDQRNEENLLYFGMRNVDETAEEDLIKKSFVMEGGKVELSDQYFMTKFGKPTDTDLHFIKRDMNDGDDITNLNNLETFLFGDPKKPNQYALLSKIDAIVNSQIADSNMKYYYLDNMLDWVKLYQREIDSYTPAQAYMNQHAKILMQLDEVEKIINRNIDSISQYEFAKTQKFNPSDSNATKLDMIKQEGKYAPKDIMEYSKNPNYEKFTGTNVDDYNPSINNEFLSKSLGVDFYSKNILNYTENLIDKYLVGNISTNDIRQQIKNLQIKGLSRATINTSRYKDADGSIKAINTMEPTIEGILRNSRKLKNMSKEKFAQHAKNIQELEEQGFNLAPTDKEGRQALQYVLDFVDAAERVKKKYGLYETDNLLNMFQSTNGNVLTAYNQILWRDLVNKNTENGYKLLRNMRKAIINNDTQDSVINKNLAKGRKDIQDSEIVNQYLDVLEQTNKLGSAGIDTFKAVMNVFNKVKAGLDPTKYGAKQRELEALTLIANNSMLFSSKGQFLLMKELIEDNMKHPEITLPSIEFSLAKKGLKNKTFGNFEAKAQQAAKEKDWIDEWTKINKPKKLDDANVDKSTQVKQKEYKSLLSQEDLDALNQLNNSSSNSDDWLIPFN